MPHTPGPLTSKNGRVFPVGWDTAASQVAKCNTPENARLFSAAPELLEALKEIIDDCSDDMDVYYISKAQFAIKKAKEES